MNNRLRVMVEGAIFAALGAVLSMIPLNIGPSFSVSLGAVPLLLYTLRHGFVAGTFASTLWGILHVVLGYASILTPVQGVLEYAIAFAFAGAGGIVATRLQESIKENRDKEAIGLIIGGSVLSNFARYFIHFIAGYYFWGAYAPEGMNAWMYSFVMNGLTFIVNAIFCAIILIVVYRVRKSLYVVDKI